MLKFRSPDESPAEYHDPVSSLPTRRGVCLFLVFLTSYGMDDKSYSHTNRWLSIPAFGHGQPNNPVPRSRCSWTLPLSVPYYTHVPLTAQPYDRTIVGYLPDLPFALEPSGAIVNPNTLEPRPYTCYPNVLPSPHPLQPYDSSVAAYLPNPHFPYDVGNPMEPRSSCPPASVSISAIFLCFGPCIHCRLETLPPCTALQDANGSESLLAPTQCLTKPQFAHTSNALLSFGEIVPHLNKRGCPDLSDEMDTASYSNAPVNIGGLGDVYKGKLKDGTPVAIKVIRSASNPSGEAVQKHLKASRCATRELYVWWKCKHKNVQRLLGLVEFRPGQLGMVSPWEKHGNVKGYLRLNPTADPCQIVSQAGLLSATALTIIKTRALKSQKVFHTFTKAVHGDLKAENILVSEDGTPMLADFGCSTLTREWTLPITSSTPAWGSLRWAAPEILQGENVSSPAADVYALGMTILEMMTGQLPWSEHSNVAAVVTAVILKEARPRRPLEVIPNSRQGDNLWSLLGRCWISEPTNRPTAAEVGIIMNGIKRNGLQEVVG
ncbi:hypothetical protein FRC12_011439 [Ceratobasidium sp. 428]|nr:hypothetical protein FRC12_011439 [Ceratobasidium sp. 428]